MAMFQKPGMTSEPQNDLYTVLLVIGTVFLIIATIVLAVQYHSYYGLGTLFSGTPSLGS
jgi:hypothetical protein